MNTRQERREAILRLFDTYGGQMGLVRAMRKAGHPELTLATVSMWLQRENVPEMWADRLVPTSKRGLICRQVAEREARR